MPGPREPRRPPGPILRLAHQPRQGHGTDPGQHRERPLLRILLRRPGRLPGVRLVEERSVATPGRRRRTPRTTIARAMPRRRSGGSRWAPASQVRAQARGTTRYASYPPPPVASHRPPAQRCATASTSRAASAIAVVVTRRCASGSQACESAPCWETTTSGPNTAASVGTSALTAASQAASPQYGSNGMFTADPAAGPIPELVEEAGPGEQVPAALVERQREDPGIAVGQCLDAIAVVDVEVHVEDPEPLGSSPYHGERDVVVDAEARRPVRHRVVEPTAGVMRMERAAGEDRLHAASEPPATAAAASCMPAKDGLSARPIPMVPVPDGSAESLRTAATYSGRWRRSRSSRVAGSGSRPGTAPR